MPEIKSAAKLGVPERNDYIFGDVYGDHEMALNEHVAWCIVVLAVQALTVSPGPRQGRCYSGSLHYIQMHRAQKLWRVFWLTWSAVSISLPSAPRRLRRSTFFNDKAVHASCTWPVSGGVVIEGMKNLLSREITLVDRARIVYENNLLSTLW